MKIQRVCKTCGKQFEIYESSLKRSNASGNFCCRQCYNNYLKTLTGQNNKSYNRVDTRCSNCDKPIKVIPSRLKTYKTHFCCMECKRQYMVDFMSDENNPFWRGGASKYRGNFDEVKRKYFNGTNFCAICGTTKNIHIHHIIPYRLTQDNSRGNLIPLCNKHHKVVENVSVKFIDTMNDFNNAQMYLNNILRARQKETLYVIKELRGAITD